METFINFEEYPIGGMLLRNGYYEEFDMVNVTAMSYICHVKLACNFKADVVKVYLADNSTEIYAMVNDEYLEINGYKVKSAKTFHDFAKMVKNGAFDDILTKK
jgi:hypothetical protein